MLHITWYGVRLELYGAVAPVVDCGYYGCPRPAMGADQPHEAWARSAPAGTVNRSERKQSQISMYPEVRRGGRFCASSATGVRDGSECNWKKQRLRVPRVADDSKHPAYLARSLATLIYMRAAICVSVSAVVGQGTSGETASAFPEGPA